MFCPQCGDKIEHNELYCNKCGRYLGDINQNNNSSLITNNKQVNGFKLPKLDNELFKNKKNVIGIGVIALIAVFLVIMVIISNSRDNYYFSTDNQEVTEDTTQKSTKKTKKGKYSTAIVADNRYSGVKVLSEKDAYDLIVKDSVSQKSNCPSEIKTIEDEIIDKYGITAVNLCEMDIDFAKEISNVIGKIYDEYPSARGILTNLTLKNVPLSEGYIAAFYPFFDFATSDAEDELPLVVKTQILLNTTYYLNTKRLNYSVTDGSKSGHFPPNATIYSPVAHEFGHYLSFLALMKHYELDSMLLYDYDNYNLILKVMYDFKDGDYSLEMITEAYNKYKKEVGTTLDIDTWRGQISSYAVAKDNDGNYIYDETIAEAFHDVYLNDEKANIVSKYVVSVLKSKLEG